MDNHSYLYFELSLFLPKHKPLNQELQRLFDNLEADRHSLLDKVRPLSTEQFNRAAPGTWSVSQILSHLITAEKISRLYMNKKILGIREAGDTGIWEEIKMVVIKLSQRLPFKFKAPKVVVENTLSYVEFTQLASDWGDERAELRKLLETFSEPQIKKKIYRHVHAGRLNIQHALIFFREHYIHHWPQIKRLL